MLSKKTENLSLQKIKINDNFWSRYQKLVKDFVIPYQEQIMDDKIEGAEKSHAFENFRIAAGEKEGDFYGFIFQDSDVAKWLEAVSYSLAISPDAELEKKADDVISLIQKAQQADGYLDTYFIINKEHGQFENLREAHELYCMGHMMEAAAAHYEATGKKNLLEIMEKAADLIYNKFIVEKIGGFPGHQEVEIGLLKMYRATGNPNYLETANYFINERGQNPKYFVEENNRIKWSVWGKWHETEFMNNEYNQAHLPVREQKEAVGHAVRAVYMYTAMADLAVEKQDEELYNACLTLWENITSKRMYVTGAIGSNSDGEAFTIDYDLPNDTIYGETCASIGLIFFAEKLLQINPSNKYTDVIEQVIYNSVISGMQLDGRNFFYCNPLEVNPELSGKINNFKHVVPQRPKWYACACCPPNVSRLLTSLGKYVWGKHDNTIFSHLYMGGEVDFDDLGVKVKLESNYPWDASMKYTFEVDGDSKNFKFALRIPSWAKSISLKINGAEYDYNKDVKDGYCYISREWKTSDTVEFSFDLSVRKVYANSMVRANQGRVALMRGPVVYCVEGVDNDVLLQKLYIPKDAQIKIGDYDEKLLSGIVPMYVQGKEVVAYPTDTLYSEQKPEERDIEIKLIPYYSWGNRGINQMRVWLLEK